MIAESLDAIVGLINNYILPGHTDEPLVLSNISRVNDGDEFTANMKDKLVLSIVNIEEDRIAKSPDHFIRENNLIRYKNPAIHLNLTLLFSATHDHYPKAISLLEMIIRFFQIKYVFTPADTPELNEVNVVNNFYVEKMIFDWMNLNLEQVHQLWTTLGGHYIPSVIFKMRMITIDEHAIKSEGRPIKEIEGIIERI